MKVITIWQPYASLVILGHKKLENRDWVIPGSLVGQRVGIAAAKTLKGMQVLHENPEFMDLYNVTGAPHFADLPTAAILGTVLLKGWVETTFIHRQEAGESERIFGHSSKFFWKLEDPVVFEKPFPVQGKQGFFDVTLPAEYQ